MLKHVAKTRYDILLFLYKVCNKNNTIANIFLVSIKYSDQNKLPIKIKVLSLIFLRILSTHLSGNS
nr:hypothetical protein B11C_110126 [Bartonella sp. 1-1C]